MYVLPRKTYPTPSILISGGIDVNICAKSMLSIAFYMIVSLRYDVSLHVSPTVMSY